MNQSKSGQIDSVMNEDRLFAPSQQFVDQAEIKSMDEYQQLWDRAKADPTAFWDGLAKDELHWFKPYGKVLEWEEPYASWFVGGETNASYNCLEAQAYIADTTSLEQRPKGMALIGMAFGLGFTFGPLLGYLAIPSGTGDPGPLPGFAAAALSLLAFFLAVFWLPESLHEDSESASHAVNLSQLREALCVPSVAAILFSIFVCVFSFANFETTLALMIKGRDSVFRFSFQQVCLTFAYIGFVLAVVQGGFVRRLAGRVSEGTLAAAGAIAELFGFLCLILAMQYQATWMLFLGLTIVVSGFAFITPSLNSLLSRRSDPNRQGGILGVGQSVNSLGRIAGSGLGIPLLKMHPQLPAGVAMVLMALGFLMIVWGARSGQDFGKVES